MVASEAGFGFSSFFVVCEKKGSSASLRMLLEHTNSMLKKSCAHKDLSAYMFLSARHIVYIGNLLC